MTDKIFLFYVIQVMIIILLVDSCWMALSVSLTRAESGGSIDGLYLLVFPFLLLPIAIFLAVIKWLLVRKVKEKKYRKRLILPALMLMLDAGFSTSASKSVIPIAVILTLILVGILIREMISIRKAHQDIGSPDEQ